MNLTLWVALASAAAPEIQQLHPSGVNTTEATLSAKIKPGEPTTYHFEYVDLAGFEAEEWVNATSTPTESISTESLVSVSLNELQPDTAYRFRVIATNVDGTNEEDAGFHTYAFPTEEETCPNSSRRVEQHSTFLPDCRAYEQVSPPGKNGSDVLANPFRTRVAADGQAIQFISPGGFGDVSGGGASFEYIAERGASAWSTHGISPALPTESSKTQIFGDALFKGEFSPDLSRGIFHATRPLSPGPTVGETPDTVRGAANLYLRDDLTTPGPGSWQLITPCPACYVARLSLDASGGEFTLAFKGQETAPLPYNASAEAIREALAALPTVGAGNVRVSTPAGQPEGTHDILFAGSLSANTQAEAEQLVASLSAHDLSLAGGAATIGLGEDPISFPNAFPLGFTQPMNATAVDGASADFSHVYFETLQDLTAEAPPQSPLCDKSSFFLVVFCSTRAYEWDEGVLRLAGILPNGDPADASEGGAGAHGPSPVVTRHAVSNGSDGHYRVIFTQPMTASGQTFTESGEPALNYNGAGGRGNLYIREDGSKTVKINQSERTAPAEFSPATFLDATPDGTRVVFLSGQALTDEADSGGLYLYDVNADAQGHHLKLMSEPGLGVTGFLGISDDGHYAYYVDATGTGEIHFWHDGVSKLFPSHRIHYEDETMSLDTYGQGRQARVTPDGQHLIWRGDVGDSLKEGIECTEVVIEEIEEEGDLKGTKLPGCREIFVYSASTGQVSCASCPPSGEAPTSNASTVIRTHTSAQSDMASNRTFPDNGRYVFFSSRQSLLPRDTNGVRDVYEYDTESGKLTLLSSGTSKFASWYLDTSADGRDVFIATSEPLVAWDTDGSYDVYDVRVAGGYPEPPAVHALCSGDACQGSASPAPQPSPLSSSIESAGNAKAPPTKCPKGQRATRHKEKVRCTKSHHRRGHRQGGRAGR